MTSKSISETTMVPLGAVLICFAAILGAVVTGSFWVKGVNDRLARIEEKLGIATPTGGLIPEAKAEMH